MRTCLSSVLLCLALTSASLEGQEKAVGRLLSDTALKGTSWSICFADAITGEILYGYDAERNLAPASVTKLYPASAALSLLGPDYVFSTTISMTGRFNKRRGLLEGDIVIVGGGDPALGSSYFTDHYGDVISRWVIALKEAGLKRVKGRVAAAESVYDSNPAPGGWTWSNLGQYYGAGVYDININDNKYNIYVTGFEEGTAAIIDSVDVYGKWVNLTNYLISSGKTDEGYVFSAPYSDEAWISGTVPADSSIILRASNPNPPYTVVMMLDNAMRKAGIRIDETPSEDRVSLSSIEMTPVCKTLSPSLGEIIRITLHESVNMYAEQLRKHLGYAVGGEGSFSMGSEIIRHFLDSIGCDPHDAVMLDGSGLSPNNNISSLMTVQLLVHMSNSKDSAEFRSYLPAAGETGTMKNYFRDEAFRGRVIAKTGSIGSVRAFAGYVTTSGGRKLAFTMIANGFTVPWRLVTNHMEQVVKEVIGKY